MIRLQLIDRADIARAMALMAIERAAATPVVLIKRNKPNDALPSGMKPRSPQNDQHRTQAGRSRACRDRRVDDGARS